MKRTVLTIVSLLAICVVAQAQEKVRHMVVKTVDDVETVIPVSDISEITFADEVIPSGFTVKPFSVSDTKTVFFSPGNLWYQASTGKWKFAYYQDDIVGEDNENVSAAYDGWIDLFGFGTGNNPAKTSAESESYAAFTDWGREVADGNIWYTLSKDEWEYFYKNHENRWITVNDVNGRVFLPDDSEVDINSSWNDLEAAGAVFLPAAGYRGVEGVGSLITDGYYWSSTSNDADHAYFLNFSSEYLYVSDKGFRPDGQAVRLVRTAEDNTTYAVTFDTDGGNVVKAQNVLHDEAADVPDAPTKEGYIFKGWYIGDTAYDFSTPVTGDITLTAQWESILFSVSETKNVLFSTGNLQYQSSTNTWRFADHQWDIIGKDNQKVSDDDKAWIDLFGWGTGDNPTQNSGSYSNYSSFTDWGNEVGDGKTWFTLSKEEWEYFYNNHESRLITVNGVAGWVFLPDNSAESINADWEDLEAAGAVFLPLAGYRSNGNVLYVGSRGSYWSSTPDVIDYAFNLFFNSNSVGIEKHYRSFGRSVRLVREVE